MMKEIEKICKTNALLKNDRGIIKVLLGILQELQKTIS